MTCLSNKPAARNSFLAAAAVAACIVVVAEVAAAVPEAVGQRWGPIHNSGSWQPIWSWDCSHCTVAAVADHTKTSRTETAALVAVEVAVRKGLAAAWVAGEVELVLAVRSIPAAVEHLPRNSWSMLAAGVADTVVHRDSEEQPERVRGYQS